MDRTSPEYSVLKQYGIEKPDLKPVKTGLINQTWLVTTQQARFILQLVNPMFSAEIHEDIDRVTAYIDNAGLTIPRLLRTRNGELYCIEDGQVWRLYTCIAGTTHNIVTEPEIAHEAGVLLGAFHRALDGMDYQFRNTRPGVHDTQRHLEILKQALNQRQEHPRYQDIKPLATDILEQSEKLPRLPKSKLRKVHGDPKINNFLFDTKTGKGMCMLDFDTLSSMQVMLELGDAMRSWCNPVGEDDSNTSFSVENFRSGLEGYRQSSGDLLTSTEWEAILPATLVIFIELSARFCADALNEDYFAWDSQRFSSHSEHSQIRAASQLTAGKSLLVNYKEANSILRNI